MGIYIKGRKYMPENCAMCPLCHRNFDGNETRLACYALKKWCDENIDRLSDCPLVEVPEPHGRLIDADALVPDICHDWEGGRIPPDYYSEECIREAPTVIEAEDGT